MITLSLSRINAKSPYEVRAVSDGDFEFITDCGIHYIVNFIDDTPLGGCATFQFAFKKNISQRSAHDIKVATTIHAIIDEFFRSNLNVLLYICDTSDHREEYRNRLFLQWFEYYAESNRFTIRTANAEIEGEGFYVAIIVENRNPKLGDIIREFEETSRILTQDKP